VNRKQYNQHTFIWNKRKQNVSIY